jgi:hypothetical protein
MKKIVLILLFILLIVGVVSFLVTRSTKKSAPPIPITTIERVSAPRNIEVPTGGVTFSYTGPSFAPPEHLPTYMVSYPPNLPAQAASLTKQWGFTKPLAKPVPYVYDWIEADKRLSYNDQSKSISVALFPNQGASSPALSLTPQGVFSTLSSFRFISKSFSYTETNSQVVEQEGEGGSTESATLATSYQSVFKNQQFPFFFSGLSRSVGEMRTTQGGRVVSFSFYVTPELQPEQERQVLRLEQILNELNDQKGYLNGLSGDTIEYPFEEIPSFSHVNISMISVAYLYIAKESRFVPIFIIEGEGEGPKNQRVRYYLRATS